MSARASGSNGCRARCDAIRHATQAGWHVFVVTNQSGVARGYYDEAAVRDLLDWMADEARRAGGTIDDTRYCPFHEEAAVDAVSPQRIPGASRSRACCWT